MKESYKERIERIKEAGEDIELLKKSVCPFFELGGHTDCISCMKDEDSIQECKDVLLERLPIRPMDIWSPEFDLIKVEPREKVSLGELSGIGITCDFCYMSDKCPLYKKSFICGIDWGTQRPTTAEEFMDFLIGIQHERVQRAAVFEKVDGGVPDANLSNEMDRLSGLVITKADLNRDRVSLSFNASGPATNNGGGILAKLFGGAKELPTVEKPKELGDSFSRYEEVEPEPEKVRLPRKSKKEGVING